MKLEEVFAAKYDPENPAFRYGTEIELGWRKFEQRDAFLTELEKKGLGAYLCSKHDGSVNAGAGYPSELVSIPLTPTESMRVMRETADVIEAFSTKGMQLGACGVHVHITKKALDDATMWKIVQAVSPQPESLARWAGLTKKQKLSGEELYEDFWTLPPEKQAPIHEQCNIIGDFWDLLSLRKPGAYNNRGSWNDLAQFKRFKAEHGKAQLSVAPGKHTPTVELRMFRSARSPQVLLSYIETVNALIAFSKTVGGKAWPDGVFPVKDFMRFVQANRFDYPALGRRLELPKFERFTAAVVAPVRQVGIEAAHDRIAKGCLVLYEACDDPTKTTYVVWEEPEHDPEADLIMRKLDKQGNVLVGKQAFYPYQAIHVCPGAQGPGGLE